jgi:hypothetical protein
MTKLIQGNINYTDEGNDLDPVACNPTTATLIKAAHDSDTEVLPVKITVYHDGNKTLWVKTDAGNDKRGIAIHSGSDPVEIYNVGAMYFGDIYAIYDTGPGGNVYVSWI